MRGFSLVELLAAMSITLLVVAATLSLVGPAHDAFQVQPESADLQQRVRVGVDALQRELLMAGAGMYSAGSVGPLHHALAPVMPYRAFGNSSDSARGIYFRPDAISLMFVPSTSSQTTLAASLPAGALDIGLEDQASCPPSTVGQVCGLEAGDTLLVFDRAGWWEVFAVERVEGVAGVRLRGAAPVRDFAAGSSATEVRAVSYSLKDDAASGAYQLVRADASGPAQPVLDHVVKLEFRYFGEPLPPRLVRDGREDVESLRATYGLSPPPPGEPADGWPPAENCLFSLVDGRLESRLTVLGAAGAPIEIGATQFTDGPWCPHAAAPHRFDADLLRIRRVRFTLRVQSALASLRGAIGPLFARGGAARAGGRYVPDLEIQLDVTPRNLSLPRED